MWGRGLNGTASAGNGLRFLAVGLMGVVVDVACFQAMLFLGAAVAPAQVTSFLVAVFFNYALNARWAFAQAARNLDRPGWALYARFLAVCLLALFLRSAALSVMIETFGWAPQPAVLIGIVGAAAVNFAGAAFFVFPRRTAEAAPATRWAGAAVAVVAYVLLLKLAFMGLVDLTPEEAYYWGYAQWLDIGYLDHPPMVAWLIWLSTSLVGDCEIGVRLPALACSAAAATFVFLLARNLVNRAAAFRSVLLFAVLPVYFAVGFMTLPDAPLYAAWAGCLYFLERALIGDRPRAWWGAGLCLGLGMLSKYTIALLAPATLAFVLLDAPSRRWLRRPHPYVACLLAGAIFSPVLIWNIRNEWASFAFQSTRRLSEHATFSLHLLVASVLVLLTPVGVVAVVKALASPPGGSHRQKFRRRRRLFALAYMLVPLGVFVAFSLGHPPKLNWTGPIWLAVLPLIAQQIVPKHGSAGWWTRWAPRLWLPTVTALLVIYGGMLYALHLGLPEVPGSGRMETPLAWQEMAERTDAIAGEVEAQTGTTPIIAGMDRYGITSELAFYQKRLRQQAQNISARHLFGSGSLMWRVWSPAGRTVGRDVLLVAFDERDFKKKSVTRWFERMGDISAEPIRKNGRTVAHFYWRIGHGYRDPDDPPLLCPPSAALLPPRRFCNVSVILA